MKKRSLPPAGAALIASCTVLKVPLPSAATTALAVAGSSPRTWSARKVKRGTTKTPAEIHFRMRQSDVIHTLFSKLTHIVNPEEKLQKTATRHSHRFVK